MHSKRHSVRNLAFVFRADPALIAGIEVHSRNTIVRNSWRADIDRIREELGRDEHPRAVLTAG